MQALNNTAHRILDTAEQFTQTRGFNAFSYKDIQNELGIKTSSIHYYFPTKNDLALVMAQRYIERFELALADIADSEVSGLKRLEAITDIYVSVVAKGRFCLCGMLASDMLVLPEDVMSELDRFFHMVTEWLQCAINKAIENEELARGLDVETAADQLLSLLEGAMLIARSKRHEHYLKRVVADYLTKL